MSQRVEQKIAYLRKNRRSKPVHVHTLIRHGQREKAIEALQAAGDSWSDKGEQNALLERLLEAREQ